MDNEALKTQITALAPTAELTEEGSEYLNVIVGPEGFHDFMTQLHDAPDFLLDYMFCLTGVDMGAELLVVYHLKSTAHDHSLVVKVKLEDRENTEVTTVSDIWRTAEFHELEVYDLFGVVFLGHPGLRRLFLTDDWVGWPMRKDYVDEINIVER